LYVLVADDEAETVRLVGVVLNPVVVEIAAKDDVGGIEP
jgi:hypothetical protein